jgi:pyruvate/2-oxoglutarate dehydrogenase complex dihydrolipoamide acyltransferase (E2) component
MSVSASQILASQPPSLPPSQRDAASQGAMRLTIPAPAPDRTERVAPDSFNNAEVGETPDNGTSEGLSFFDFLDLINPLQHIPIVSSIYRELTGDTIRPEMQMAGAGLLGGPLGLLAAGAHAVFEAENGRGVGEEVLAQAGFGGSGGNRIAEAPAPAASETAATETAANETAAQAAAKAAEPERMALNAGQANGLDALIAASSRQQEGEGARVIARFQVPPQANTSEANASEAKAQDTAPAAPTPSNQTPSKQTGGVPSLMQDALQKYEALMRARQRGET